jgi:poly(ADP-ribose) glycohydrolase
MSPKHDLSFYPLPSSPTIRVLDRFSLLPDSLTQQLEDSSGYVPFWPLLSHLLFPPDQHQFNPTVTTFAALTSLLDTISVTLRDTSHPAGDYALLREAITSYFGNGTIFFTSVWPMIVDLALEMPILFPSGKLPILGRGGTEEVVLSRRQAACLVVHLFLRTVSTPEWKEEREGLHDFGIWYAAEGQRQVSAARMYLAAVMRYLGEVICGEEGIVGDDEGWVVRYTLRALEEGVFMEMLGKRGCPLREVEVQVVERYDLSPASLGVPGGAAVVSANKYIGFGQSATQEEVHVGSSPEACLAVLFTPPLRDDQVLIVRGAQAMVNITGQRRDIRAEEMPAHDGGVKAWRERTMLFMDALELDMVEAETCLPDLLPGKMDREIRKACTAFSSDRFREVRTGLWGCGAFNGDPGVKMLLLWLAASLAATRLVIVCDRSDQKFAEEFRIVVGRAKEVIWDTADLRQLLDQVPRTLVRSQTLPWVREQLEREQ